MADLPTAFRAWRPQSLPSGPFLPSLLDDPSPRWGFSTGPPPCSLSREARSTCLHRERVGVFFPSTDS